MIVPDTFICSFKDSVQQNTYSFEEKALALFQFQASHNLVYKKYIQQLGRTPAQITKIEDIPFLPIEFFKNHLITSTTQPVQAVFESSGTTGQIRSRHYVYDTAFYQNVASAIFEHHYGPLTNYHILALLPSYVERTGSSLVYMVEDFIRKSGSAQAGFFLHNHAQLLSMVEQLQGGKRKILLIGVTFALLDLAEQHGNRDWSEVIVMETGGMKGRRQELLREEVHEQLQTAFHLPAVHSEYGMTELLSQAYSTGNGLFQPSPTLRVYTRDPYDPFCINNTLRSGGLNVIDLANVDSCAFIETKDIGSVYADGTFQVLGRFDNSDIRGCNLLVQG